MLEKIRVIKHSHIDLLSMARIPFVLFGFVEEPTSHLGRSPDPLSRLSHKIRILRAIGGLGSAIMRINRAGHEL